MKIELYIDKQLCDVGDPKKFSVTLKRQLYNPSELNTKDAQASYTITLPASNTNNRIFGYANVEEVKGKFERLYDAELIVNGIRIFEGKFKLSEIDSYSYKGNLGIPAPKTAKDIFGEKKMNEMGEWKLPFKGVPDLETKEIINLEGLDFITYYNNLPDSPCIFPFVLYGLLPKVTKKDGTYSDKEVFDETVRLGIEDFPPSVNCMQMLKYLFRKAGYRLTGTALSDEKLNKLYVSYKNPNNYTQEWNWGDLATIDIKGSWSMADRKGNEDFEMYERCIDQNSDDYGEYFSINLFNSNRLKIDNISDTGTNVQYSEYLDDYSDNDLKKYTRKSLHVVIPRSGYYKVRLKCESFKLFPYKEPFRYPRLFDTPTDNRFTMINLGNKYYNSFARSRYELQVLRDYGEGDFHNTNVVGWFNKPQFPQEPYMDRDTDKDQYPKYYPAPGSAIVVDPRVNQNFINGLHWGEHGEPRHDGDSKEWNPKDWPDYGGQRLMSYYMFIANGFSWDKTFSQKAKILSAYDSSFYDPERGGVRDQKGNYYCYGVEDPKEGETTEPEEEPKPEWLENRKKIRYGVLDYNKNEDAVFDEYYIPTYPPTEEDYDRNCARLIDVPDTPYSEGEGTVESIIWLEKGERIAVSVAADMGDSGKSFDSWITLIEQVKFSLHIEPFRTDILWNNFDSRGNYNPNKILAWNDDMTFETEKIDLGKFLPSGQKIDDWIENFCKAFNLNLVHDEGSVYRLDVKQKSLIGSSDYLIDLDTRAHVLHRSNQSLGLPRKYELGFSVNTDEEGYFESIEKENPDTGEKILDSGYKGGGIFDTGSHDTDEISQTSNFSYCWYKTLTEHLEEEKGELPVPVISDHEVWADPTPDDYKEMMKKQYFDKAQRFWYKDGTRVLPVGNPWTDEDSEKPVQKQIDVALVDGEYDETTRLILDYEDKPDSIMRNYFFLLDNSYDYTEIECILTPEEYNSLTRSLAKFNGDLYNIVSVDGYDPACRKPAKLKMIRKVK